VAAEAEAADTEESDDDSDSAAPREDGANGETRNGNAKRAPNSRVAT